MRCYCYASLQVPSMGSTRIGSELRVPMLCSDCLHSPSAICRARKPTGQSGSQQIQDLAGVFIPCFASCSSQGRVPACLCVSTKGKRNCGEPPFHTATSTATMEPDILIHRAMRAMRAGELQTTSIKTLQTSPWVLPQS